MLWESPGLGNGRKRAGFEAGNLPQSGDFAPKKPGFPALSVGAHIADRPGCGGNQVAEFHIGTAITPVDPGMYQFERQIDEALSLQFAASERRDQAGFQPVTQFTNVTFSGILAHHDPRKFPTEIDQAPSVPLPEYPIAELFLGRPRRSTVVLALAMDQNMIARSPGHWIRVEKDIVLWRKFRFHLLNGGWRPRELLRRSYHSGLLNSYAGMTNIIS